MRAFNSSVGSTGLSETAAAAAGVACTSVVVHGLSHASYYPAPEPITLKAVYDPTTLRLLGAQAAGGLEGVDKRLDVLATGATAGCSKCACPLDFSKTRTTPAPPPPRAVALAAIAGGMLVTDLAHLELAYAPPFGSARDVINTLGFAAQVGLVFACGTLCAQLRPMKSTHQWPSIVFPLSPLMLSASQNVAAGLLHPAERVSNLGDLPQGRVLLDVRDATSSAIHPVLSSDASKALIVRNVPLEKLRAELPSLDPTATYTTVCGLGKLSYFAERTLTQAGLKVTSLMGGLTLLGTQHQAHLQASEPAAAALSSAAALTTVIPAATPCAVVEIDACGLACPGPIIELRKCLERLPPGGELRVKASDPGFQVRGCVAALAAVLLPTWLGPQH
jgi:rhodanese-related sulfurtransferase